MIDACAGWYTNIRKRGNKRCVANDIIITIIPTKTKSIHLQKQHPLTHCEEGTFRTRPRILHWTQSPTLTGWQSALTYVRTGGYTTGICWLLVEDLSFGALDWSSRALSEQATPRLLVGENEKRRRRRQRMFCFYFCRCCLLQYRTCYRQTEEPLFHPTVRCSNLALCVARY